jgi:hypothetical protein
MIQPDPFSIATAAMSMAIAVAAMRSIPEASAEPNKEQYELQERCGKRAAEVFKSYNPGGEITNTDTGQDIVTYQNHYSARFNKCFVLQITTSVNFRSSNKSMSTLMTLFDVNENKDYGQFFKSSLYEIPTTCEVQKQVCHSQTEWEELLKPYMEE